MKRRIIQLGGRTLLVSIPYQWASEHDITKGSELNITETPQGLLVHTGDIIPKKECVHIDSRDVGRLLRRTVLAEYTNGAYEVIVTHKPSEMKSLQDLANQYFQWILISCYKAELSQVQGFTDLVDAHRSHSISYWEKERGLWALFGEHIEGLDKEEGRLLNDKIVAGALSWFNRFVKNVNVQYDCTCEGLSSVLK